MEVMSWAEGSTPGRRRNAHGSRWAPRCRVALAALVLPAANGLHDMGGNAWEWVDEPRGAKGDVERRTRGGSWWYGAAQMRAAHLQGKPPDTAVAYIGFRCARDR